MRLQLTLVGLIGSFVILAGCGGAASSSSPATSPSPSPSQAASAAASKASQSGAPSASVAAKPAQSSAAASANLEELHVGAPGVSGFDWPSYAAQDHGYFTKQGLKVTNIITETPSNTVKALIGGSLNLAQASADAPIVGIEGGAEIVIVGQEIGNPAFSVVTQPEIKSWNDLKGGTVAVSGPTDGAAVVFRRMAQLKGFAAQKDYSFVSVGTTPNRYAALQAHQVKAAIMNQPVDFQAIANGFNLLDRSDKAIDHYAFYMVTVQKAWGQAHRATVTHYLTALSQAIDWLYDPANKDAAIRLLADKTKTSADAAGKTYQVWVEQGQGRVLSKGAKIDVEGLRVYGSSMQEAGLIKEVDPARWTDVSYAK